MTKNNRSIVIQWGSNIPGRESMGLELFLAVSQHYQGLVTDGKLGNFQTVLLEQGNLGTAAGLMLLTGTEDQIGTVLNSDKHRENLVKASLVVTNLTTVLGVTNDEIPSRVQQSVKWRSEMGL